MKVRERSLGNVSVVQIARAVFSQCSWLEPSSEYAEGILWMILRIGRLLELALWGYYKTIWSRKLTVAQLLLCSLQPSSSLFRLRYNSRRIVDPSLLPFSPHPQCPLSQSRHWHSPS